MQRYSKYLEIEPGIYKYSYLLELLDKKLNDENKKDICMTVNGTNFAINS